MSHTWINNIIWWHIYPLGFTGAPVRPSSNDERRLHPRLDQIIPWLDYMKGMGANGLALCPIFQSNTHGYDTTDFLRIDSRLGDGRNFDRLIAECRARGIPVMLDGVFNHVSKVHPLFLEALDGGPAESMFRITRHEDGRIEYADFEGHQELAAFNHDNETVVDLVVEIMCYWLRRGASAWRLDAAYAVPPAFWSRVLPRVRAEFPDAWFVGEVIHGDYPQIVRESTLDAVTQYHLWHSTWTSLHDRNFFELDTCLKRNNELMAAFTPMSFIGNHDVPRLATKIGNARTALAFVILMTVGGIPSVYYGDEQLFRGDKGEGEGHDDALRPAFPHHPSELASFGQWMYDLLGELTALRHARPWLTTAMTEQEVVESERIVYRVYGKEEGQEMRVSLSLNPRPLATIEENGEILLTVDPPPDEDENAPADQAAEGAEGDAAAGNEAGSDQGADAGENGNAEGEAAPAPEGSDGAADAGADQGDAPAENAPPAEGEAPQQ